jgi:hypothetical protein
VKKVLVIAERQAMRGGSAAMVTWLTTTEAGRWKLSGGADCPGTPW